MKKVLGILGGMGPAATADLYGKVVSLTAATKDGDHIRTIIDSNAQIPDRTQAILSGGESPLEEMESALDNLACCGAEVIIIPCNTAHYFLPALKEYAREEYVETLCAETTHLETEYASKEFTPDECTLNLEFVSMIEETAKACAKLNPKTAAVLATKGTLESGLYQKALNDEGVNFLTPDEEGKDVLMKVIYDGVKAGAEVEDYIPEFAALLERMKGQGADYFVLACTELPIAFAQLTEYLEKSAIGKCKGDPGECGNNSYSAIDPTEELAKAAILACGYTLKA